ncbi:chain length determinant protein EpsF [Rubrivivax gelatinosus]|nr:chain length determinant protein EpsF [Rubrivivax gelatinosus]
MTISQFLSILRARWWVLALLLGLTVVTTVTVSLMLPKQYQASASVVVDFKPDPISMMMIGTLAPPAFMATQMDIIQSERVAQRVVKNTRLNENPQVLQQWRDDTNGEGTIEQWLGALFQRQMDVKPSRDSSVITINYRAPDSRFAAAMANAFVQAYIQTALELRVDPARQYSSYFDSRAKEIRSALENAQSRYSAFQSANGITATDERLDVESARLAELSSQLVAMQALAMESSSRQTLATSPQADRLQEVLVNPVVNQLKSDISRGEARLQELNTRYGDRHPQVIEIRANLAELRGRLNSEIQRVTGGVGVANRINRQREAELRAALDAQRSKVLKLKAARDEGSAILREVETAQRAYDALQTRFNQADLESQTTQSNVNVLTRAEPPLEPSSPKVALNGSVAAFVGLMLGIAVVMLLEMLDRRIRGIDDVAAAVALPVIGLMPGPASNRLLGRNRQSMLHKRLMAPVSPSSRSA